MASYTIHAAANALGSQINTLGTKPDVVSVVPAEYGNTQPAAARNFWVNIEEVSESRDAETSNSYLQTFTLGVWVWIATPAAIGSVASTVGTRVKEILDLLLYNTLGGWARVGITNDDLSEVTYIKGPISTTVRYGAHFTIKVTKQATVGS